MDIMSCRHPSKNRTLVTLYLLFSPVYSSKSPPPPEEEAKDEEEDQTLVNLDTCMSKADRLGFLTYLLKMILKIKTSWLTNSKRLCVH